LGFKCGIQNFTVAVNQQI